jgi:hypothetical protein
VAADSHPDRLNSDEVALVLRRAADLEARTEGRAADDGFDAAAVEEAALEVGLSPAAVRQALAELHTGALATDRRRRPGRTHPSIVQVARLVPCPPEAIHGSADRYFQKQTLELRRRQDQTTFYRQRRDMAASLRRGLDFNGAIRLEGVSTLTMTTTPVGGIARAGPAGSASPATAAEGDRRGTGDGGRCMVRFEAELRGRTVMTTVANGIGLTMAVMTGMAGLFFTTPATAAALGLSVGAAVALGGLAIGRSWWRRRRAEVAEVLGGLLDSFEQRPGLGP